MSSSAPAPVLFVDPYLFQYKADKNTVTPTITNFVVTAPARRLDNLTAHFTITSRPPLLPNTVYL